MDYDDGARTIFLYTKGTKGNPPEELRQFLHYMEHTVPENATNDDLRHIQEMVETVKKSEEVSTAYMKIFEREEYIVNRAVKEAIQNERANTEQERMRAENAEARVKDIELENHRLKEELRKLKVQKH